MGDATLIARGTCVALVITCSDFRFKSAERAFAESARLRDDYDLIARPGAIRPFAAPRVAGARESLEAEIELLWNVHHFPRILMLNHVSCRAYDDLVTQAADERALHRAHLRDAGTAIERRFPRVAAEAYLLDLVDGALRAVRVGAPETR